MPLLLILLALLFPLSLAATEEKRVPTKAECAALSNPDMKPQDRIALELSFFPRRPICEIISRPYGAYNLFHTGQKKVRLHFIVSGKNIYEPDLASLLTALAPDRDNIPKDKTMAMAGQIVGAFFAAASGNVTNPHSMMTALANMGEVTGALGNNAAAIKAEAASLRIRHSLKAEELVLPKWLDTLVEGRTAGQKQTGFLAAVTRMMRNLSKLFPWMNQSYGMGE